jgi:hypothetical protein
MKILKTILLAALCAGCSGQKPDVPAKDWSLDIADHLADQARELNRHLEGTPITECDDVWIPWTETLRTYDLERRRCRLLEYRDPRGGIHFCPEPVCWSFESQLCTAVACLTAIKNHTTDTNAYRVADEFLREHWQLVEQIERRRCK